MHSRLKVGSVAGVILLLSVAAGSFGYEQGKAPPKAGPRENLDDRDVIQAALLSFLKQEPWYAAEWKSKDHVVLRIRPKMPKREDYAKLLDQSIEKLKPELEGAKKDREASYYVKRDKLALEVLLPLKRSARLQQSYVVPGDRPLIAYAWDRRILPTDKPWSHLRPLGIRTKRDPEFADVRVFAQVDLPTYSPDGSVSIVSMSIPWSIHSADVTFIMRRKISGWKILYGGGVFFV